MSCSCHLVPSESTHLRRHSGASTFAVSAPCGRTPACWLQRGALGSLDTTRAVSPCHASTGRSNIPSATSSAVTFPSPSTMDAAQSHRPSSSSGATLQDPMPESDAPACDPAALEAMAHATIEPTWSWKVFRAHAAGKSGLIRVPSSQDEAAAVFWLSPTAIVAACGICALVLVRLRLGVSVLDAPAAALGAVAWALQEWFIHAKLLHSSWDWPGKRVHEGHHQEPYYHITIDPVAHVAPAMAASLALFTALAGAGLGQSAALAYWSMGLLYVYAHYIVHTRATPSSAYWRRVRQHHMQHHCRNEDYWLSFCVPAVDSLMRTNPAAGAVPMTEMAKAAVRKRC